VIAVAHPDRKTRSTRPARSRLGARHGDTVAAPYSRRDGWLDLSAQKVAEQLQAIADSENRDTQIENLTVAVRGIRLHRPNSARRRERSLWDAAARSAMQSQCCRDEFRSRRPTRGSAGQSTGYTEIQNRE
jgi:hypothetical protein